MQGFNGKIEGEARSVISTLSPLTNQPVVEVNMANQSLPLSPKRHYRHPGCRVPTCRYRHKARGYCNKHYQRVKEHGDPFIIGRRWNHTAEERFWDKVDKTPGYGPRGDCWLWVGGQIEDGYGRFRLSGKSVLAHRYSYYITHGRWPEPCGLHSCDNPPCVNPSHISEGTKQDNATDKVERGRCRGPVGSEVKVSKLSETDIPVIREMLGAGISQQSIADQFQVSQVSIGQIGLGKTWKQA